MCFDTAKSKISKNAAIPAKNYGFTKQNHIRGDKTLKIKQIGPNVVCFVVGLLNGNFKGNKKGMFER